MNAKNLEAGSDIWVEFEGAEHAGTVVRVDKGWVIADILVDPVLDYGAISASMSPISTVAVQVGRVRERTRQDSPGVLSAPESETM